MLMEIDGDTLTFNTISRTGSIVDSGSRYSEAVILES